MYFQNPGRNFSKTSGQPLLCCMYVYLIILVCLVFFVFLYIETVLFVSAILNKIYTFNIEGILLLILSKTLLLSLSVYSLP